MAMTALGAIRPPCAAAAGRQRDGEGAGAGVRWRKMLDGGVYATLEELPQARGGNATYVSRILRLTLLAPDIVETILDGGSRRPGGSLCVRRGSSVSRQVGKAL